MKNGIKLLKINDISIEMEHSFENLPNDNYLREKFIYRKRRYSTGRIANQFIHWDKNNVDFFQSECINKYLGGIKRTYHPIEEVVKNTITSKIMKKFIKELPNGDYNFGVHQIRIIANDYISGKPAPEGIHKDGVDYISILCIKTKNVSGGISIIFNGENYTDIKFEKELKKNEVLIFSDKEYAHYTSPITPKVPNMEAIRDVIIITFTRRLS